MSRQPHIIVSVKKLHPDAILPQYQSEHAHAAGMDLHLHAHALPNGVPLHHPCWLDSQARVLLSTGISLAIPAGYEGQIRPRSGLALKHGVTVLNSSGTIDSDYRGEIKVLLINLGSEPVEIKRGDRIAQIVFAPVAHAALQCVENFDDTARGSGGFGSTDKPSEVKP